MYTEEDPVMANTMKIRIISHLWSTTHLFSNFLNKNKKNFNNAKPIIIEVKTVMAIWKEAVKAFAILNAEYSVTKIPKKGNTNCQFR